MAVMAGFQSMFVFRRIGRALLAKTNNTVTLAAVLFMLCFFSSMLVTNDVALITFVPFAVDLFMMCGKKKPVSYTHLDCIECLLREELYYKATVR